MRFAVARDTETKRQSGQSESVWAKRLAMAWTDEAERPNVRYRAIGTISRKADRRINTTKPKSTSRLTRPPAASGTIPVTDKNHRTDRPRTGATEVVRLVPRTGRISRIVAADAEAAAATSGTTAKRRPAEAMIPRRTAAARRWAVTVGKRTAQLAIANVK